MFLDCEPLISTGKSAPMVMKRKPPPQEPNDTSADISISRPVVVLKTNQGMIPPPPASIQTSTEKLSLTKSDNMEMFSPVSTTPTPAVANQPLILSPKTLKDNRNDPLTSGHSDTLSPNESESIKPTSPSCLRPYRKVEDVTTVKRQPKSGWL